MNSFPCLTRSQTPFGNASLFPAKLRFALTNFPCIRAPGYLLPGRAKRAESEADDQQVNYNAFNASFTNSSTVAFGCFSRIARTVLCASACL